MGGRSGDATPRTARFKKGDAVPKRTKRERSESTATIDWPRLRNRLWRDRFAPDAEYVFSTRVFLDEKQYGPGDKVPADLPKKKLWSLWRTRRVLRTALIAVAA